MHFTYCSEENIDASTLAQGDLLQRTPELSKILLDYHSYYHDKPDYGFFTVLTQSCDLVRSHGRPLKAKYIVLAAVRPFWLALEREAKALQKDPVFQKWVICEKSQKREMIRFVERVLNNNHPDYFYFHEEASLGVSEPYCAFLPLSIALKAEHIDVLLGAKILQLTEPFQHKLGYLVGHSYARVGTDDWVPRVIKTNTKFRNEINRILDDHILWVDKRLSRDWRARLDEMMASAADLTRSAVVTALEEFSGAAPKPLEIALERIGIALKEAGLTEAQVTRARNLIASDGYLRKKLAGSDTSDSD